MSLDVRQTESASATVAQSALSASPLMALRRLQVERVGEQLVISGTVSTFYQKQQAQELVRARVAGITVVNNVNVT